MKNNEKFADKRCERLEEDGAEDSSEASKNKVFEREPCVWDTVNSLSSKGIAMVIMGIILLFVILSLIIN